VLPNPLRYATLAALALGAMVSFGAVSNLMMTFSIEEFDVSRSETPALNKLTPNPVAWGVAQRAQGAAYRSAVEQMRWPRALVLFGLAGAAALVFISALRLRWPAGVGRTKLSLLLSRSAIASAVFRTLEGAQELVIVRSAAAAFERSLIEQKVDPALAGPSLQVFTGASVLTTAAVTALFLGAASYFKSERIQQTFELIDRNTVDEE
jgi:hypothetical protein